MTKPTRFFFTLGTLALALSVAPLFAKQQDANSPSSSSSSAQSQQSPGQAQPSQPPASQPPSDQASSGDNSQTFSGTVAKSGNKYVLQDASGKTYDVDRQDELKKFEGKEVRIKGTLDPDGKTIHVK